jgi:hypothetical protein
MRSSCENVWTPIHQPVQHRLRDSVLHDDAMREDVKRGLTGPLHQVAKGAKRYCPHLSMTLRNVDREQNKAAETVTTILLAQLHLRGLEVARAFPRKLDALLRARVVPTSESFEIEKWNALETELQGAFDRIQVELWRKNYSTPVLMDALDTLYRIRDAVNQAIEWLERRLYRERQ